MCGVIGVEVERKVEAVTSFVSMVFAALGFWPNVTANVNGMPNVVPTFAPRGGGGGGVDRAYLLPHFKL